MTREQHLLLIKRLPPDLRTRLKGTDPNVLDVMTLHRSLVDELIRIIETGDKNPPTLEELFERYFSDPIFATQLSALTSDASTMLPST